jgi:predicted DNA-binding transcriptional regulator YafY
MTRNLARYEQFLRILAVLDILAAARGPLDDQALIAAVKERLGLSRLSSRTLHRDCEFLISCGYPIDHAPLPTGRKYGWRLDAAALASRRMPPEPLTLLELTAFSVGRDLLRAFEGTVLWTGIESLWAKLQRGLHPSLAALELERLQAQVPNVVDVDDGVLAREHRSRQAAGLQAQGAGHAAQIARTIDRARGARHQRHIAAAHMGQFAVVAAL